MGINNNNQELGETNIHRVQNDQHAPAPEQINF